MVSHLLYYQLALLALVWLFIMLHLTWPTPGVTAPAALAEPEPITPKRPRFHEPKAFEGLTAKPHCALCARDTVQPKTPPPVRPDPMAPTHRRPRTVDTSMHFCPHTGCRYRGWLGLNNLRSNGHPHGGPWRQFHCTSCGFDHGVGHPLLLLYDAKTPRSQKSKEFKGLGHDPSNTSISLF
jgi:hypothetical protein